MAVNILVPAILAEGPLLAVFVRKNIGRFLIDTAHFAGALEQFRVRLAGVGNKSTCPLLLTSDLSAL